MSAAHRLAGAVDVVLHGPRERAHGALLDDGGDRLYGLEIALAGCRKSGFDDVDTHLLELSGDAHLLV